MVKQNYLDGRKSNTVPSIVSILFCIQDNYPKSCGNENKGNKYEKLSGLNAVAEICQRFHDQGIINAPISENTDQGCDRISVRKCEQTDDLRQGKTDCQTQEQRREKKLYDFQMQSVFAR